MSRTDSHAPFHVRMARGEVSAYPVHRCAGRECDLPDLVPGWADRGGEVCRWEPFQEDQNWCSCWMCHWHHRPEVRRAADRARLRDVVRAWNGGDDEAGHEV